MGYLRTNYRKDDAPKPVGASPAMARPPKATPDPGPAYGTRNPAFENLALRNIAGSITVYRVTNDFIVGLE